MSFKDINGLVQQNVQLRNQVHMLSADLDKKDMELRVNDQYGCFFFHDCKSFTVPFVNC